MSAEISEEDLFNLLQKKTPILILDIRDPQLFMEGHIQGSANAKCENMQQKQIIMSKIPRNLKIVLVDDDGSESSKNANMMRRFGFDAYYLKNGIKGWHRELVKSNQKPTVSNENLWSSIKNKDDIFLLDVREPQEFSEFRIPGSVNIPLSELFSKPMNEIIPKNKKIITICSHGNRSKVATFALAQKGIESTSLEGGMVKWNQVLDVNEVVKKENFAILQVEKIGKGCLSHIINSNNEAVVIDPTYPAEKYIDIVSERGWKIVKVLDTHQHADHVSAAKEVAYLANADLYISEKEEYQLEAKKVNNGDIISFGDKNIKVIHTPGHTVGSMTYVIDDKFIFIGDILFVEGIGRPDLRNQAEKFARELYKTLHQKVLKFPTDAMIFPTHHGENVKPSEKGFYFTTVDNAKKIPMLHLDEQEFVKKIVGISTPRPMNYSIIIKVNKGLIPIVREQIPDLEMGPNRCSINV